MSSFNYIFIFMCLFAVVHFVRWFTWKRGCLNSSGYLLNVVADFLHFLHLLFLSTNLEQHRWGVHGGIGAIRQIMFYHIYNILFQDLGMLPPNPARQRILAWIHFLFYISFLRFQRFRCRVKFIQKSDTNFSQRNWYSLFT